MPLKFKNSIQPKYWAQFFSYLFVLALSGCNGCGEKYYLRGYDSYDSEALLQSQDIPMQQSISVDSLARIPMSLTPPAIQMSPLLSTALTPISGGGFPQTNFQAPMVTFNQNNPNGQLVDVVLIIDNSLSFVALIPQIRANFPALLTQLSAFNQDYIIYLGNTSSFESNLYWGNVGRFKILANGDRIELSQAEIEQKFNEMLDQAFFAQPSPQLNPFGSTIYWIEQGPGAIRRPLATTRFIYITNGDQEVVGSTQGDPSYPLTPAGVYSAANASLGEVPVFYGIYHKPGSNPPPPGAEATQLSALVTSSGGKDFPINSPDYNFIFTDIGQNIVSLRSRFSLPEVPNPGSVSIQIIPLAGAPYAPPANCWSMAPNDFWIVFDANNVACIPPQGSQVRVSYNTGVFPILEHELPGDQPPIPSSIVVSVRRYGESQFTEWSSSNWTLQGNRILFNPANPPPNRSTVSVSFIPQPASDRVCRFLDDGDGIFENSESMVPQTVRVYTGNSLVPVIDYIAGNSICVLYSRLPDPSINIRVEFVSLQDLLETASVTFPLDCVPCRDHLPDNIHLIPRDGGAVPAFTMGFLDPTPAYLTLNSNAAVASYGRIFDIEYRSHYQSPISINLPVAEIREGTFKVYVNQVPQVEGINYQLTQNQVTLLSQYSLPLQYQLTIAYDKSVALFTDFYLTVQRPIDKIEDVIVNGSLIPKDQWNFEVSTKKLRFNIAPPSGARIVVLFPKEI